MKSQWCALRDINWQHSRSYIMLQPTDLFCHIILFAKSNMLTRFNPHFLANNEAAYTPTYDLPLEKRHSVFPIKYRGTFLWGNHVLCLVKLVMFMGFGGKRAKRCGGRFKVIILGGKSSHKGGGSFYVEGGGGTGWRAQFVILLYSNFIVSLTGYCNRFHRILFFTILLLFYLFCIYWDWHGQKCNLKCSKIPEIDTEL